MKLYLHFTLLCGKFLHSLCYNKGEGKINLQEDKKWLTTIKKQSASQSQKLMVFVLTMSLYGLATLFTELIPKFQVCIVGIFR